jgi:predicted translin family RNA/ssDNA-binding protein
VKNALADLAGDLVRLALDYHDKGKIRSAKGVIGFIQDLMVAAEFLAREQRGGQRKAGNP